jgi:hypothetical protein
VTNYGCGLCTTYVYTEPKVEVGFNFLKAFAGTCVIRFSKTATGGARPFVPQTQFTVNREMVKMWRESVACESEKFRANYEMNILAVIPRFSSTPLRSHILSHDRFLAHRFQFIIR